MPERIPIKNIKNVLNRSDMWNQFFKTQKEKGEKMEIDNIEGLLEDFADSIHVLAEKQVELETEMNQMRGARNRHPSK